MTTSTPELRPSRRDTRAAAETAVSGPSRRALLLLSGTYAVLFVGLFLSGGGDGPGARTPGAEVISQYTTSSLQIRIGGFGMVVAAAILVFWGAALRKVLNRSAVAWAADAAFAGTVTFALTLVGWAVSSFALYDAVHTGTPQVAQALNVLDHANYVPAMLGLVCTMVGAGVAGYRIGMLPRWLAVASVVLGAMAPLGPGGFVPFSLFPIWLVVVSACLRRAE